MDKQYNFTIDHGDHRSPHPTYTVNNCNKNKIPKASITSTSRLECQQHHISCPEISKVAQRVESTFPLQYQEAVQRPYEELTVLILVITSSFSTIQSIEYTYDTGRSISIYGPDLFAMEHSET